MIIIIISWNHHHIYFSSVRAITQNNHDKNHVNHVSEKTAKYIYVTELQNKHQIDWNALHLL